MLLRVVNEKLSRLQFCALQANSHSPRRVRHHVSHRLYSAVACVCSRRVAASAGRFQPFNSP